MVRLTECVMFDSPNRNLKRLDDNAMRRKTKDHFGDRGTIFSALQFNLLALSRDLVYIECIVHVSKEVKTNAAWLAKAHAAFVSIVNRRPRTISFEIYKGGHIAKKERIKTQQVINMVPVWEVIIGFVR